MLIKFTVHPHRPRNPVAAASQRCGAGGHRGRDARQQSGRQLRQELALLERPPHRP
jgi:hypothetical protein